MPKEHFQSLLKSQMEDIQWTDVGVDNYIKQSEQADEVQNLLVHYGYEPMPEVPNGQHKLPPAIRMGTTWIPFPYVIQQTVERVVMDYMLGITHVIRGDDFLTEYSLYCYFCQKFDLPTPEFVFLPRLSSARGDISKTNGGYKIADYRDDGYTPEQLKTKMREACLIYPNNGWELYNIKSNPMI